MKILVIGSGGVGSGVLGPEAFDSVPFFDLLKGACESSWGMEER
jgi:hypothetical protein